MSSLLRPVSFSGAVIAVVIAANVDPLSLIEFVIVPILIAILAAELDREGGWLAVRVVSLATWLLPRASRKEREDEWVDHVLATGEHGFRPLFAALSIAAFAAPYLALTERWSFSAPGDQFERLFQGFRRLREVKAFPPIHSFEDITEIQLARMSDTEIVELQHAVRAVSKRGQKIPRNLIFAMASRRMSYRMHQMRGRNVRRHPWFVRLIARLKYYLVRLRLKSPKEAARSWLKS